jgi:signal peptidase I
MAKHSKPKNDASKREANTRTRTKSVTAIRIIRTTISSLLVVIVLAFAGIAAFALINGTWQINPVVSGSMRPGFSVGGIVISERIPVDQLALRDVIEFKNPQEPTDLMVHRIVRLTKNKAGQLVIKTQGDANNVEDPWTLTISGKYAYEVRWSVPLIGYVAIDYQNHRGLVLLGVGVVLLSGAAGVVFRPKKGEGDDDDESNDSKGDPPATPPSRRGFKLGALRDEEPVPGPDASDSERPLLVETAPVDASNIEPPLLVETPPVDATANLSSASSEVKPQIVMQTVVVTRPIDSSLFGVDEDRID